MSVVLQSFLAIADAPTAHIAEPEHLQSTHEHSLHDAELFSNTTTDHGAHDIADCHHCGHCQGSHAPWQMYENAGLDQHNLLPEQIFYYQEQDLSSPVENLIRPPIA